MAGQQSAAAASGRRAKRSAHAAPDSQQNKRTTTTVYYAPLNSDQWERQDASLIGYFGPSKYHLLRTELIGLTPGTTYKLRLGKKGDTVRFRTAPATLTEPITFAEGGDIGTADIVTDLHEQAASWDPLFALVGGDLAYANGTHADRWIQFLNTWRKHMVTDDGRLIPLLACIGNHEVRGGFLGDADDAPFFYALFGSLYHQHAYATLQFGDYLGLIMLDSGQTAPIDGKQTDWLRHTLETYANAKNRPSHLMAAYHVPAYPVHRAYHTRGRDIMRATWIPLFDRFNVDLVFEHDDHAYKRTRPLTASQPQPGGVVYVGDGAWGRGPRHAVKPAYRPYLAQCDASPRHPRHPSAARRSHHRHRPRRRSDRSLPITQRQTIAHFQFKIRAKHKSRPV